MADGVFILQRLGPGSEDQPSSLQFALAFETYEDMLVELNNRYIEAKKSIEFMGLQEDNRADAARKDRLLKNDSRVKTLVEVLMKYEVGNGETVSKCSWGCFYQTITKEGTVKAAVEEVQSTPRKKLEAAKELDAQIEKDSQQAKPMGDSNPAPAPREEKAPPAKPHGPAFDWSALLGPSLLSNSGGETGTNEALGKKDKVCLYFGGSWCDPCRELIPQLMSKYKEGAVNPQVNVEVVFVSSDRDQGSFDSYFKSMVCLGLPFHDRARKNALSAAYDVTGIPTLVVLDGRSGELVTTEGRGIVQQLFEPPPTATQKPGFCSIQEILDAHNAFRASHGAPPLKWSDKCADEALVAAQSCKAKNTMYHNNCREHGHGQNIFAYGDTSGTRKPDSAGVTEWYNESIKPGYPFGNLKTAPDGTGHFTQVVWRGTEYVGMALAGTPETNMFIVANYSPAGNVQDNYGANVLAKGASPPPNKKTKASRPVAEIVKEVSKAVADAGSHAGGNSAGAGSSGVAPTSTGNGSVTVEGGPGAKDNADLKALISKLPPFVSQQAPQVISNITDNLAKKGTTVIVELGPTSLKTTVKTEKGTKTSELKWG